MKYINLFDTQAEYDAAEKYYPNTSYIESTDEVVYQEIDPRYSSYLTFEALQNGTFSLLMNYPSDSIMTSISYSVDNGATWVDTVIGETSVIITTPTINAGDKVLWKGIGTKLGNPNNSARSARFTSTCNCNVSGNIMSLLYGDNFAKQTTIPNNGAFAHVFSYYGNGCKIVSAENLVLPSTTLVYDCYSGMFEGCKSLTTAPELPATTLAGRCYENMFNGCTSLTTAPELPVTTLVAYCYRYMFAGCTALATAPELPATTLVNSCYQGMFYGCSNLNNITMLATNISASNCLDTWVNNVAATGTFTKAAEMTTLPTGTSGIPSGWTVQDA